MTPSLTILVPSYNESATLPHVLKALLALELPGGHEVIVIDDGSQDDTGSTIEQFNDPRLRILSHSYNRGKGAAILTGLAQANGDYTLIFDADLEYDPNDILRLYSEAARDSWSFVMGSRTFGSHTAYSFWYVLGNRATTLFVNVLFNSYITDLHSCLKLVDTRLLQALALREQRFGLDVELVCELLARNARPFEIPISYKARTRAEGKKITVRDGLNSLWVATRVRLRHWAPIRQAIWPRARG